MKVFLDANILFSASNADSNTARFVRFLAKKRVAYSSDYAVAEASRNIAAKRPQWSQGYEAIIRDIWIIQSIDRPVPVTIADKDRPILATAIRENCDFLVTGDRKDFGHLFGQTVQATKILTIPMMANILKELIQEGENDPAKVLERPKIPPLRQSFPTKKVFP